MAERRMFAKCITTSDAFLDMPASARALYFHLGMIADDDGFVNSPKRAMREAGASEEDLNLLLGKRFLLGFESGIVVIKHWRINNYLRGDRYKPTEYLEELNSLIVKDNKAYTMGDGSHMVGNWYTNGIPLVYQMDTQDRVVKDSTVEDSTVEDKRALKDGKPSRFVPPTVEEVREYVREKGYSVNPEHFVAYYESNGWKVGKNQMKGWKAAVCCWENHDFSKDSKKAEREVDYGQYGNII